MHGSFFKLHINYKVHICSGQFELKKKKQTALVSPFDKLILSLQNVQGKARGTRFSRF